MKDGHEEIIFIPVKVSSYCQQTRQDDMPHRFDDPHGFFFRV